MPIANAFHLRFACSSGSLQGNTQLFDDRRGQFSRQYPDNTNAYWTDSPFQNKEIGRSEQEITGAEQRFLKGHLANLRIVSRPMFWPTFPFDFADKGSIAVVVIRGA